MNYDNSKIIKEIISKPPHKIIQHGSTFIFITLIITITMSFIFQYPTILKTEIIIKNYFKLITADNKGYIHKIIKENKSIIYPNDTIAVLYLDNSYKYIKAGFAGKLIYCKNWYLKKNINKNENLFYIFPYNPNHYTGYITISSSIYSKIKNHKKLNIFIPEYPYSEYGTLIGNINTVIKESNGVYKIIIDIPNKTSLNKKLHIETFTKGYVQIVIGNVSIGKRILHFLTPYNKHL